MECLRAADEDTPSSSTAPDTILPTAALLHDFAKEGKKCQDAIAYSGGVSLLVDLLLNTSQEVGEDEDPVKEAAAALCLIAVGSEQGRSAYHAVTATWSCKGAAAAL